MIRRSRALGCRFSADRNTNETAPETTFRVRLTVMVYEIPQQAGGSERVPDLPPGTTGLMELLNLLLYSANLPPPSLCLKLVYTNLKWISRPSTRRLSPLWLMIIRFDHSHSSSHSQSYSHSCYHTYSDSYSYPLSHSHTRYIFRPSSAFIFIIVHFYYKFMANLNANLTVLVSGLPNPALLVFA